MATTQLSIKFQLLIKAKMLNDKDVSCFQTLRCCIYPLINVKMPTIDDILTSVTRIKFHA